MYSASDRATGHPPRGLGFDAGTVLAAGAVLIAPLGAIAPLGIASLGALLALAAAVLIATGKTRRPPVSPTAVTLLVALLAWAAISVLWSAAPQRAPMTAVRLAVIVTAGGLMVAIAANLEPAARVTIRRALVIGVATTVVVLLAIALFVHGRLVLSGEVPFASVFRGSDKATLSLFTFNRAASLVALLIWPACAVVNRHRPAAVILAIGTAVLLVLLNSSTPILAFVGGGLVFAANYHRPRASAIVLAAGIVLVTAASPVLHTIMPAVGRASEAVRYVDGSLNHRLQIWSFVADRAKERPVIGWGLDASRALGDTATGDVTIQSDGGQVSAELLPLHPHNALLQVWVELGLVGAALTGALLLWTVSHLHRALADRTSCAAAFASFASALIIAELSYGIWQGWWQAALWLTAALTIAVTQPSSNRILRPQHSG